MKIVVLWEEDFPTVDTLPMTQESLQGLAREGDTLIFAPSAGLGREINAADTVLVTPYGSAFPKEAWATLKAFLAQGGRWLNLGGAPLLRPVRHDGYGGWHVEVEQTAYAKELLIRQAFPLEAEAGLEWSWEGESGESDLAPPPISRAWSLQPRFTDRKDFAHEHGTSGSREGVLETQLYGTRDGRKVLAPIVLIDRLRGDCAGGRWVFANAHFIESPSPPLLQHLVSLATQGPVELEPRPSFGTYYEGEQPAINIRLRGHHTTGQGTLTLVVTDDTGAVHKTVITSIAVLTQPTHAVLPLKDLNALAPGLYRVACRLELNADKVAIERETGFWVYDEALLTSAKPLSVNRDYFERGGEPFPIMGTTYMSGDVHRKFLFEPNPAVWDRDFAAMKAAGVNMVRTGLWTAWKRAMLDPGAVDEGVLRAFAAFLLTARRYDIPVTFNFFAFWPEEWGGLNPYLDPHAVSAQQELVAAFVHRFANVPDVSWDFINEPSATSPARVWSMRPNYDKFEREAYTKWIREQEPDAEVRSEAWRTAGDAESVPALGDFQDGHIFQGTHPLRSLSFKLFAQDAFTDWARKMVETVRSNGAPHQLTTVGQDEGGIWDRPNPHFYGDAVDFTTNHTWWQNDDLLWDSVITKTPKKPNVSQETGIMFVENMDGGFRRTPEECRRLLARKLALGFAAGCAGAIEWLWNTNVYMDSDNEVGIGLHRADGTEKAELEAFRGIAQFVNSTRAHFQNRIMEDVCIVIPHSNVFGARGGYGDHATRRAVRAFETELGVSTRAVSEYRIEDIGDPKLIVLPAPRILTQSCWERVLVQVHAGATLLVTGPIDWDEFYRPVARINALNPEFTTETVPVCRYEFWEDDAGISHRAVFGGEKIQRVERSILYHNGEPKRNIMCLPHGAGKVLYCPLPLEVSEGDTAALVPLYGMACFAAEVEVYVRPLVHTETLRRVVFEKTTLYIGINEGSAPAVSEVERGGKRLKFSLGAGYVALAFVDNETQGVLASYPAGSVVSEPL